ncbi:MAG: DUF1194 domain-containing protein, partial [Aestuariivirga sp.]
EGGTSISSALLYSAALLSRAPRAQRLVIDVSSDGRNNVGVPVNAVRDRLVAQGITINALTILNEWPTLDVYFQNQVVGGEGHFVIPANDYAAYADAISRKGTLPISPARSRRSPGRVPPSSSWPIPCSPPSA